MRWLMVLIVFVATTMVIGQKFILHIQPRSRHPNNPRYRNRLHIKLRRQRYQYDHHIMGAA